MVIDRQQCYDNGCDNSGCDGGAGYEEVESRWCSNLPQLCPLCKQETCCLRRPQLLCCQLLDCIEDRADCRVPQQRYLGGPNTSKSDVYFTNLAHGGTAVFPFYSQPLRAPRSMMRQEGSQAEPCQAAPKAHNTLVQRLVQRLRSAWQRLPRPPPRPLSVTAPRWPEVQVRVGAAAFSSGPALPPEVEDELYTLQDI
ncbi:uncharacterized protein HaLaN_06803, partial [Haematococcus lacustris]